MRLHNLYTVALLASSAVGIGAQSSLEANPYTDTNTNITFNSFSDSSFRFGIVMPSDGSTDFIFQLISPLKDGERWADNPITLTHIVQGTFINATHISSTVVCAGCINSDTFKSALSSLDENSDPVYFGYAVSPNPVQAINETTGKVLLSDHIAGGSYGTFSVDLNKAKSEDYNTYAALAAGSAQAVGSATASTVSGTTVASATKATSRSSASSSAASKNSRDTSLSTIYGLVAVVVVPSSHSDKPSAESSSRS
ncbi:hypothetical protein QBC35DRAFT_538977 [Podospora australis]|uniref:Cellobiose dehydrogenase-like cytochrome domain-containing protein n=1 Tax=Podospora australis TaxID=1536484 RepID=A0AAN7AM17_9PEZI|nr:hypothetical protein QBC35DRAFT_538977 [Podospora australis]